jgi:CheY-like chemotaxis protein
MVCYLIDDDKDDQQIFEIALKKVNPLVELQMDDNGALAIERLTEDLSFKPEYIFLDLNMPVMDGKTCLKQIKKLLHLKDVPVIIFTTSSALKDIQETKELGANDYIIKPSNLPELVDILHPFFKSKPL